MLYQAKLRLLILLLGDMKEPSSLKVNSVPITKKCNYKFEWGEGKKKNQRKLFSLEPLLGQWSHHICF